MGIAGSTVVSKPRFLNSLRILLASTDRKFRKHLIWLPAVLNVKPVTAPYLENPTAANSIRLMSPLEKLRQTPRLSKIKFSNFELVFCASQDLSVAK